jgi:hypothetical protein
MVTKPQIAHLELRPKLIWQPLVATAARAVFAGTTKSDPKGRKRLSRYLQQLEVGERLSEKGLS